MRREIRDGPLLFEQTDGKVIRTACTYVSIPPQNWSQKLTSHAYGTKLASHVITRRLLASHAYGTQLASHVITRRLLASHGLRDSMKLFHHNYLFGHCLIGGGLDTSILVCTILCSLSTRTTHQMNQHLNNTMSSSIFDQRLKQQMLAIKNFNLVLFLNDLFQYLYKVNTDCTNHTKALSSIKYKDLTFFYHGTALLYNFIDAF